MNRLLAITAFTLVSLFGVATYVQAQTPSPTPSPTTSPTVSPSPVPTVSPFPTPSPTPTVPTGAPQTGFGTLGL